MPVGITFIWNRRLVAVLDLQWLQIFIGISREDERGFEELTPASSTVSHFTRKVSIFQ